MGTVTIDMADLMFGFTEGWYELQEDIGLRGSELNVRNRLRLGQIRPMRPIQGAIYLKLEVSNPVQHLPRPPPQDPVDLYADEVTLQVIEENRGASRRRRRRIIKDMWDQMLKKNPRAIEPYQETLSTLQRTHVDRMNQQVCLEFVP